MKKLLLFIMFTSFYINAAQTPDSRIAVTPEQIGQFFDQTIGTVTGLESESLANLKSRLQEHTLHLSSHMYSIMCFGAFVANDSNIYRKRIYVVNPLHMFYNYPLNYHTQDFVYEDQELETEQRYKSTSKEYLRLLAATSIGAQSYETLEEDQKDSLHSMVNRSAYCGHEGVMEGLIRIRVNANRINTGALTQRIVKDLKKIKDLSRDNSCPVQLKKYNGNLRKTVASTLRLWLTYAFAQKPDLRNSLVNDIGQEELETILTAQ